MRLIRSNEVPHGRWKISGAIYPECGAGSARCQPNAASLRRHESSLLTSSRNAAPQPIRFSVSLEPDQASFLSEEPQLQRFQMETALAVVLKGGGIHEEARSTY